MADRPEITKAELRQQLLALGVCAGDLLLVHSSFRAVRPVEGGPVGLVEALLDAVGEAGTLVMPSWHGMDDEPFHPAESPADADLGVVPDVFWRLPGVMRARHAFAFAAKGPLAGEILADPLPVPPHILESPVGRVWERNGKVLLLGVDHDANTTLHLAECMARVPYGLPRYCTDASDGTLRRVDYLENDHCCLGFRQCGEWLEATGLQARGTVGYAEARLMRSTDAVRVAVEALAGNPLVFLHPADAGCEECDEARASVSG